jgi:hypothetical protein
MRVSFVVLSLYDQLTEEDQDRVVAALRDAVMSTRNLAAHRG